MEKRLYEKYTKMLLAAFNEYLKKKFTKQLLYSHLPRISQNIQDEKDIFCPAGKQRISYERGSPVFDDKHKITSSHMDDSLWAAVVWTARIRSNVAPYGDDSWSRLLGAGAREVSHSRPVAKTDQFLEPKGAVLRALTLLKGARFIALVLSHPFLTECRRGILRNVGHMLKPCGQVQGLVPHSPVW